MLPYGRRKDENGAALRLHEKIGGECAGGHRIVSDTRKWRFSPERRFAIGSDRGSPVFKAAKTLPVTARCSNDPRGPVSVASTSFSLAYQPGDTVASQAIKKWVRRFDNKTKWRTGVILGAARPFNERQSL